MGSYRPIEWQQNTTWINRDGNPIDIATMDPVYAKRVQWWLYDNVEMLSRRRTIEIARVPLPDEDSMAWLAASRDAEDETELCITHPLRWLYSRPLFIAIKARGEVNRKKQNREGR